MDNKFLRYAVGVLFTVIMTVYSLHSFTQTVTARELPPNQDPQAASWLPTPVAADPLVRMPGHQSGQISNIETPDNCLNCHDDYDPVTEPGMWQGSMMAQAARDFMLWPALAVAAQDAIWAVGSPNATDLCLRCHMPVGWLDGRSDPTNGTALVGSDYDGVQCDFCHSMIDPFFETTYNGTREGSDWVNYWDENGAAAAATTTYNIDKTITNTLTLFNSLPFYNGTIPFSPNYTESGGGQFFMSLDTNKRASFADANPPHAFNYSRYHRSKYLCSACHDVSNPVLANLGADPNQPLPSETNPAYSYFHLERTFSEFMLSAYGQQGGAPGQELFATGIFTTSHTSNNIATCQDCHMRDVVGAASSMKRAVDRPDDSTIHPASGVPQHDMTGGNVWVTQVLASAIPGSPNYDAVNDSLLNQGAAVLTVDLSNGLGVDPIAMLDTVTRTQWMLEAAATFNDVDYNPVNGNLSFKIQNNTGHKLISGYPEGRRMFINIRAYAAGNLIYEVNPYDHTAATLKGLTYPYTTTLTVPEPLTVNEAHVDELVYEVKMSSSLTGEDETFHMVLADSRYKDNRIPPLGFQIDQATERLIEPVWDGGTITDTYFTPAEYTGGYDAVALTDYGIMIPGADSIELTLYYQTTSREFIEFLRDEINGGGNTLTGTGAAGDPAYLIQTDPFFTQLRAWGDTIWLLWQHNRTRAGAAPVVMAQTAWLDPDAVTIAPINNDVDLDWPYYPLACTYNIFRATEPYFLLLNGERLTNPLLPPGSRKYTDPGRIGDIGTNYFYRIQACLTETNPVGEFDFGVTPGP